MDSPFDLHVLSTPPAFILSQDQTLNKMVSKQPCGCSNHLIETINHSFKEIKSETFPSLSWLEKELVLFWCLFFTLFNLQGTHSFALRAANSVILPHSRSLVNPFFKFFQTRSGRLACGELCYISTPSSVCQALFSNFLKFSASSHSQAPLASGAWLIYQTF